MSYNPEIHHRRSIRLKEYDYSQAGLYFITICTYNRECLFGEIVDGRGGFETRPYETRPYESHPTMILNEYGKIVETVWNALPQHYSNVQLDEFVVMPNHIHGIIVLTDNAVGAGFKPAPIIQPAEIDNGAGLKPAPTETRPPHALSEIVRALKTFSARKINDLRGISGVSVWQRNYFEHIIRNNESYCNIAEYIATNPQRWDTDKYRT